MTGITLITCTADHPEAFRLCELWFSRQTYPGDIQWIVSDGGDIPAECHYGQLHLQNGNLPHPEQNFLNNLLRALERVAKDKVLFFEHDDWYRSDYLEQMSLRLDQAEIAGEARARYYNVQTHRYHICRNQCHASLCQTGIQSHLVPLLLERIQPNGTPYVDIPLWQDWTVGQPRRLDPISELSVGIKGLPGKRGIGMGHRMGRRHAHDPDWSVLTSWLGEDADIYRRLMEELSGGQ